MPPRDEDTQGDGIDRLPLLEPVEPHVVLPGEGETTDNGLMLIKVRAGNLGNYWSMMQGEVESRQLLAPHTHQLADQLVYVIEGTLVFEFGGEGGTIVEAPKDSYVVKPRTTTHTFWNPGSTTTRYIEMSSNVDFERFVDESNKAKTLIGVVKAAKENDVEFHPEQIPRLMKAHKLTSVRGVEFDPPKLRDLKSPKL